MKLLLNGQYIKILEANTFKERLIGLIGQENIDYGMLFPACNSIHTFLMKEPIDVIGIDENHQILFIERNLRKNRIVRIHHPIKKTSILELPHHSSFSFHLGEKLFFEFEDIV